MANIAVSSVQNILPVQALFNVDGTFNTFIGQGQPFYVMGTETISITNTSVNANLYPTFTTATSGGVTGLSVSSSAITFNPGTATLTTTNFAGSLTGTASSATNLAGGVSGQIPYQSASGTTSFVTNSISGYVLTSNGTSAPTWQPGTGGLLTISSVTGATTYYPAMATALGATTSEYIDSSNLTYTSGVLSGTFRGNISNGTASHTSITGTGVVTLNTTTNNQSYTTTGAGTITIGSGTTGTINNMSIGATAASTGAFTTVSASGQIISTVTTGTAPFVVSSTTPVANLSIGGNAASATTATTANNATNTSIVNNTTSSAEWYPTIVSAISGNLAQTVSSANFSFVPSTGVLSAVAYTGTWGGDTIAVNQGGTGATTLTGYVKGSGTSALTANAKIPTTDLSGTITNAQLANSTITINGNSTALGGSVSVGTVTSVTGTSPVVSSGGATPAISMPAATTSVSGYLTSTDWNTFNSKANAFTYTTNYIPYGAGTTTPNQNANFTFDGTTQTAPIQRASNGIVVNSKTVSASYSIASGDSGMSVGPLTLNSGVVVTVPSGSKWVIL
jgi:hypothetical protein